MSAEEARVPEAPVDVAAVCEENARLRLTLSRLVADLHDGIDAEVHVDLDAAAGEAMVRVLASPRAPFGPAGMAELDELVARLAHVQRDMRRIEQQVEKLLWRVGEPAPPLSIGATGSVRSRGTAPGAIR